MPNPMTVRRLAVAVVVADPVAAMATVVLVVARVATPLPPYGPMLLLRQLRRLWWRSPLFKKLSRLQLSASQWLRRLNLNRRCRLVVLAAAVRRPPDQRRPTRARSCWINDGRGGSCWTSTAIGSGRLILTRRRLPARTSRGSSSVTAGSGVDSGTSSASRMGISVGSGVGSGEGSGVWSGLGSGVG